MNNRLSQIKSRLTTSFFLITAFFVPFVFANGLIYAWLVLFAFTLKKTDFSDFRLFSKQNIPQIAILLLYLLGVTSLLWADNTAAAVKQLTGQRLLMLLLPLAAIVGLQNYSFTDILKAYVLGSFCFLLCIFSFLAWQIIGEMPTEFFTSLHYISGLINDEIMHRSYIGLNFTIAIISIIYLFQNGQMERRNYPIYAVFFVIFLFVLLYLSSRAALISVILLMLFYCGYFLRKSRKLLFAFSLVFSLFFALFFIVPNRLADSLITVQEQGVESLEEPRIEIWKNAWEVILNQPFFGYGTAFSREALLLQFEKNNFQYGMTSKLNAHNQYLEYLIEYGWTGLFLFLIAILSIPIVCSKNKRLFYIPFVLVVAVNLFFETMLSRNSGVVTFTFFVMLLGVKNEYGKSLISEKWKSIYLKISIVLSVILLLFVGYSYYNLKQQNLYFFINPKIKNEGIVQIDKHLKADTWGNNAYYFSPFLYGKLTENQRLIISTEAYISIDFNGNWAKLAAETHNDLANVYIHYDMSQKGSWQHLELILENMNEEVKVFFYISQYNQTNFDNLQGKVLFRNTTYSITER